MAKKKLQYKIAVLINAEYGDKNDFMQSLDSLNFIMDGWRKHFKEKSANNDIAYVIDVNKTTGKKKKVEHKPNIIT